MSEPPVNVATLRKMKLDGTPIACLTAYDASYAVLVDAAGTDLVLVGDSAGSQPHRRFNNRTRRKLANFILENSI